MSQQPEQNKTAEELVDKFIKMNWPHEYAENGVVSRIAAINIAMKYTSQQTASLQKQVEELQAENEGLKALLAESEGVQDKTALMLKNQTISVQGTRIKSLESEVERLREELEKERSYCKNNGTGVHILNRDGYCTYCGYRKSNPQPTR